VRDARALEAALGDPFLTPPFLAQELVEGEDVDLSFLAVDGELAAWAVQTRRADRTVDFFDDARVVQLGRGIAKAAHYTGLAHVDMRYTDAARSGVKVIECNPRIWLSAPLTLGLGVDFIGRGLALAAGEGPPPFAGAPADSCADLAGLARALGRRPLTACERAYLSHTLRDPLPVLYRRLRTVLGIAPGT
jgi:predicted ATP-grasp superfamily ATP-dependent carboligase